MISFKALVITSNRRKDGTYPVVIRVYFNGATRRLPTTIVATPADLTRSGNIKSNDIQSKANRIIDDMREAVSDISPFDLESWSVDRLVRHIKSTLSGEKFELDFFAWADEYLAGKKDSTRVLYTTALNTFERFLGQRSIDINEITRPMLLKFVDFVDSEPKMVRDAKTGGVRASNQPKLHKGASTRHIMKMQHIFNAAKDRYNDEDSGVIVIPRSPFNNIAKTFPVGDQAQRNLGVEVIQQIIDADVEGPQRIALDAFLLSFCLMGANMADLYEAEAVAGDTWRYNRRKTADRRADHAEMQVVIPDEARPYIARLQEKRSSYWLPVLRAQGKDSSRAGSNINLNLKRWAAANGIPEFTFYAARHSWATLARHEGVEKATVDECLCHKGDYAMADIYAERSWELMRKANRKVLDLFRWPTSD